MLDFSWVGRLIVGTMRLGDDAQWHGQEPEHKIPDNKCQKSLLQNPHKNDKERVDQKT